MCMHVRRAAQLRTCAVVCMYLCMRARMCVSKRKRERECVCMYAVIYVHACMYLCMHVRVCVSERKGERVCVCMYVFVYACKCVCVCASQHSHMCDTPH